MAVIGFKKKINIAAMEWRKIHFYADPKLDSNGAHTNDSYFAANAIQHSPVGYRISLRLFHFSILRVLYI